MEWRYAVALTGGIATGKSTAAETFGALGYAIIDADTVAHRVLDEQAALIAEHFGSEMLSPDGRVDRKPLGAMVFADPEKLRELEGIVHPLIEQEIMHLAAAEETHRKPYLIDLPLFYERAVYPIEQVAVVYVPRALQMRRLMARGGLSEAEAHQRLDAQMDIEEKRLRATWVIDNTGDRAALEHACREVSRLIQARMV